MLSIVTNASGRWTANAARASAMIVITPDRNVDAWLSLALIVAPERIHRVAPAAKSPSST